ncbi:MAG TPA: hypothetical protein VEC99_13440, partial [Clostridia bacterium]|nr:hypothetical protein [Clostridia bacterium]
MRTHVLAPLFVFLTSLIFARAEVITLWDFNSTASDTNAATGATSPSYGNGTAALLGKVNATFATGSTNDPARDNSGWNTSSYPTQGNSNKTAGVQFNVSTLGYSQIAIRWDHRVSNSASKYCRLQYSIDGSEFFDCPTPVTAAETSSKQSYYEEQFFSLESVPDVENNPNFAFRIVSEFESTALGYGTEGYVTTYPTNNYSRSGTIRLDMVTVSGTKIPGANTAPHISKIPDQTLRTGKKSAALAFTVSDAEDPPANLSVQFVSSVPNVVPKSNIALSGSGADRSVTITAGQPGETTITLVVHDSGGSTNTTSFVVTVLPSNTLPVISHLHRTNTIISTPTSPLEFTVGDLESAAADLVVTASSANPQLVPNDSEHLVLGGSGSNRFVTVIPSPGQTGVAPITLT